MNNIPSYIDRTRLSKPQNLTPTGILAEVAVLPETQVYQAIGRINIRLEDLVGGLNSLRARLVPIMRPEEIRPATANTAVPSVVPLVVNLDEISNMITEQIQSIHDMMDRLEI